MDSWKLTEKNIKTYNPLNYDAEKMNYKNEVFKDKTKKDLVDTNDVLRKKLLGVELEDINEQEMQQVKNLQFQDRVAATRDFARNQAAEISKTHSVWGNSTEMELVMKMVAGLNSLLEGDIPRDAQGNIRVDELKQRHLKGYEAALNACNYYLEHKNPGRKKTIKRYRRVEKMKLALEKELELLSVVVSNIGDLKYTKEELENIKTPRDLLSKLRATDVQGEAKLQIEGNSTDVYRVYLTVNGKSGFYYFKQNTKPIGDDVSGYASRRIRQLNNSKENKGNPEKEETRLYNKIDDKDYEMGLEFLGKIQKNYEKAKDSVKDTKALEERYKVFFSHDFDRIFEDLNNYNAEAIRLKKTRLSKIAMIDVLEKQIKERAKGQKKHKDIEQKTVDRLKKEVAKMKTHECMTEYQWIVKLSKEKDFGISESTDKALFNILKNMSKVDDKKLSNDTYDGKKINQRISRFFKRTLGKEVELYGQQKERNKAADDELAAKNNTATYRLANKYGFNDVVTSSESAVINIKLAGMKDSAPLSGTISKEAEGLEMMHVVELAEKSGAKLQYSSKALRQLTRLQMFDTACMQTDRHWRNFKCKTKPDLSKGEKIEGNIVIESIGSYDHDQSFGEVDLKEAFKSTKEGDLSSVKNGMLPPVLRKIKKSSPEAVYYGTVMEGDYYLDILDNMEIPLPKEGTRYYEVHKKNIKHGPYGFKTVTYNDLGLTEETARALPEEKIGYNKVKTYNGIRFTEQGSQVYLCDEQGEKIGVSILTGYYNRLNETAKGLTILYNASTAVQFGNAHKEEGQTRIAQAFENAKMVGTGEKIDPVVYSDICSISGGLAYKLYKKDRGTMLSDNVVPFETLKLEDQIDVARRCIELYSLMQQVDCSGSDEIEQGYVQFHIEAIVYHVSQEIKKLDAETREAVLSGAKKVLRGKIEEKKKAKKKKSAKEDEYIEVPTMMHMDLDAYQKICEMNNSFEDVKFILQDLGWNENKINKFKSRLEQQIQDIQKCQVMAEKILAKKYPENSALRKFFLEPDDFKNIKNIKELAWDPGMSYFSTEDENYLMSDSTYRSMITDSVKDEKLKLTNKHRKLERLHGLKQDLTEYFSMVNGEVVKSEVVPAQNAVQALKGY